MKKPLTTLFALTFVLLFGLVNVASAMKHEGPAAKADAKVIAKACKGKKAGDVVTIDGKEVTCPEKKAMKKKSTEKKAAPATPATPAQPAK